MIKITIEYNPETQEAEIDLHPQLTRDDLANILLRVVDEVYYERDLINKYHNKITESYIAETETGKTKKKKRLTPNQANKHKA